ncbi:MAG TPA: sigma-54 dependent transcriptional regulator [Nitrospirota bacterium]|nr:sigma-54 dependent transcriptional regulator [Nitrospirota bacterium]
MAKSILIVEDEETLRESIKRIFTKEGYAVDGAESAEKGLILLETNHYDVIISDIILPGMDGIEMLSRVREQNTDQIVIIITAYASLDTSVKALRAGAYDYIMKPIIHEEIKQIVRNALKQKSLQTENILLKRQIDREYDFSSIIGTSPALKDILDEVKKITDARSNVLILGETGTGKELFARVIHHNSPRRDMPFVPINCSAIPENLLESELFGHVRGAFTGAVATKKGILEEAEGGTVFLDEIGDMSMALQAKLLRVIEDQVIRPVGSTKGTKVDIRFVTATNKDLKAAVRNGSFREDLYYRINVITLNIPPLRERKEDIGALVQYYLEWYSHEMGKQVKEISSEAMEILLNYDWAGNVRELQNVIERAILISDGDLISPAHLPGGMKTPAPFLMESFDQKRSIEDYTKAFILRYQTECNEQQLAERLGITRKSLWEKRKKWGIPRER